MDNDVQIYVDLAAAVEASDTAQIGEHGTQLKPNTTRLEIVKTGTWKTPGKGNFSITADDLSEMADNFNKDIRPQSSTHGLPIDEDHTKGAAIGWMKNFHLSDDKQSLFSDVEWTAPGLKKIKDGTWKFFSPEIRFDYNDPEGKLGHLRNVVMGGGATNRPLFKALQGIPALTANEGLDENNKIYLTAKENEGMDLKTLRGKTKDEVGEEGLKVLTAAKDQLTTEELTKFGLGEQKSAEQIAADEKAAADKKVADEKAAKEAADKKVIAAGVEGKENEDGSVTLTASEFAKVKKLEGDVALGVEASEKLLRKEAESEVDSLCFSEKDGFKYPKEMRTKLVDSFLEASDGMKDTMKEMWKNTKPVIDPKAMGVNGSDADGINSAQDALEEKATELLASEAGKDKDWRWALKEASRKNPDLAKDAGAEMDREMPQVTSKSN